MFHAVFVINVMVQNIFVVDFMVCAIFVINVHGPNHFCNKFDRPGHFCNEACAWTPNKVFQQIIVVEIICFSENGLNLA